MGHYDHLQIEERRRAQVTQIFRSQFDASRPKYYVLDMFPYPSGAGLHVGHPLGYIATDIVARYKKLKGFNVLHPMGFDSFGLPAENYAIQTGKHPAQTTEENIRRYKEQLSLLGLAYNPECELRTSDPNYYKWTQKIFLLLFGSYYDGERDKARPIEELIRRFERRGSEGLEDVEPFTAREWNTFDDAQKERVLSRFRLAYRSTAMVNWCPALGTVLANDEVKDGLSIRGGHPVEQRPMQQWALRITAYAERLLNDLSLTDWPASVVEMQKNWIGRSQGAQIVFRTESPEAAIEIFTTRPDTIFGVSFIVLAPEHALVKTLTRPECASAVADYLTETSRRSERERLAE
ncbi:MAG: class I tRNA ligase family protein, partial [Bacteroidia bacterium]|nr:class I tRNA ligase family protein [Bacteroidia bacterium]